jgi:hypothetical protein
LAISTKDDRSSSSTDVHDELEHQYSEMIDNVARFRRLEMMQVIGSPDVGFDDDGGFENEPFPSDSEE